MLGKFSNEKPYRSETLAEVQMERERIKTKTQGKYALFTLY